jgi:5-methylthioadenosine/S-adenosylhomocysteine deaminase
LTETGITAIVPDLMVVNENEVRENSCLIIEGGRIRKIDHADRYRDYKPELVIKGNNIAAIPSLVNSHTHISERLLSGAGDGLRLHEWLQRVVWPHCSKFDEDDAYAVGRLFAMECIASGVGVFNDMFVSNGSSLLMNGLARAIAESGLKGLLGRGINERDGDLAAAMNDMTAAVEKWHGYEDRVFTTVSPTLIHSNSEETLLKLREFAYSRKLRIHIHVAETIDEYRWMKKNHSMTSVEYLEKIGFLDSDVMAAHLVWLGANDMNILKNRGVSAIYNPLSNARLGDGIPPAWAMISKGIPVGLGTDGSASSDNQDIFAAMRLASFLPRAYHCDGAIMNSKEVFAMATRIGYKVLGLEGGELSEGNAADITLIDLHHPSLFPPNDLIAQLVMSSHPGVVKGTIVNGKTLYFDGRFSTLDKEDIMLRTKETIEKLRSSE